MHKEFLVSSICPEARFPALLCICPGNCLQVRRLALVWGRVGASKPCRQYAWQAALLPLPVKLAPVKTDLNYPPSSLSLGLNGAEQAVCFVYTLRTWKDVITSVSSQCWSVTGTTVGSMCVLWYTGSNFSCTPFPFKSPSLPYLLTVVLQRVRWRFC